jgi:hypothetical protein
MIYEHQTIGDHDLGVTIIPHILASDDGGPDHLASIRVECSPAWAAMLGCAPDIVFPPTTPLLGGDGPVRMNLDMKAWWAFDNPPSYDQMRAVLGLPTKNPTTPPPPSALPSHQEYPLPPWWDSTEADPPQDIYDAAANIRHGQGRRP